MVQKQAKILNDNCHITVTVKNLLPYGVFVRLENGTSGYIRRREMSWEGNIEPHQLVHVGQQIEAVMLNKVGQHGSMELSHKATMPDPWVDFLARYRAGDVVEGRVKDVRPRGLFVEILPGVVGFIFLTQLAPWDIENIGEVFWVDDRVEATITKINKAKKHVRLSIRRCMEQKTAVSAILERVSSEKVVEPIKELAPPLLPARDSTKNDDSYHIDVSAIARVGPILVVEDGNYLRDSFVHWLQNHGFQVTGACDAAVATKQIQEENFGLCFVDLDLPGADGLAFIQYLRQERYDCHVVIMSSAEWLVERTQEIEQAGVLTVLFKPLNLDEISKLLNQVGRENGHTPQWKPDLSSKVAATYDSFQNLADMMQGARSFEQRLQRGLGRAFKLTEAEMGIVFYLDPSSRIISIKAQVGRVELNEDALFSLIESPVKDVLREGGVVFETAVSTTAQLRFRKLLNLLPFESCIGIPLNDSTISDYALFLFHRKQHAFTHYRLRDAQSVAALLTVAIERQALEQRVQAISGILLSGQLSAGFGHEVNNKISAMEIQLRNLKHMCANLDDNSSPSSWQYTLTQAKESQNDLLGTAVDLKKTVYLFQNLTQTQQAQHINVTKVLHDTQVLLQPVLSQERTQLLFDLADDLPLVPGSMMRLQQVFLNIMLNSIQHMPPFETRKRQLHVTATLTDTNDDCPLKLSFTDTGMGIHKHHWQRIFDLGFSTRTEGSGLGLFIARSLAASMGGRVSVEQSFIPAGTTFVVALPIVKENES